MNLTIAAQVERKVLGNADQITFLCNECELIGDEEVRALFPLSNPHASISSSAAGIGFIEHAIRKSESVDRFLASPILDSEGGVRLSFYNQSISVQVFLGGESWPSLLPDIERALENPNLFLWMIIDVPESQRPSAVTAIDANGDLYLLGIPQLQLVQRHIP